MISIKLYNPKTGDTNYYEQKKVPFGKIKKIIEFNKAQATKETELDLLQRKLEENGSLSKTEETKYLNLQTEVEFGMVDPMVELVVDLFNHPKVTKEAIYDGLDLSDGIQGLSDILTQAMGGKTDSAKK